MLWNLIFGCLLAVFGVFGFVCAVQMILEVCFPVRQMLTAVELRTPQDAELLEMLLKESKTSYFRRPSGRVCVLMSDALCEKGQLPTDVLKLLKKYGADCYIVENQIE